MKAKRPQITEAILSKKTSTEVITKPDFKLYYKSILIKPHGTGTKKYKQQWNRIDYKERNPRPSDS